MFLRAKGKGKALKSKAYQADSHISLQKDSSTPERRTLREIYSHSGRQRLLWSIIRTQCLKAQNSRVNPREITASAREKSIKKLNRILENSIAVWREKQDVLNRG